MTITFFEIKHTPRTQNKTAKTIPNSNHTKTTFTGTFFVVGRTNTGGRYYSKTLNDWNIATKIYKDYCDIVSYFGGGTVELYSISKDGYDIISSDII